MHPCSIHIIHMYPSFHYLFTHSFIFSFIVHPSIHLSIIHSSVYLLFICLSSIHPITTHQSTHLSSYLSIPYIYLFIYCPSIHVSIHLSVYPSIHSPSSIKLVSIHQSPIHCTSIHIPNSIHLLSIHLLCITYSHISPSIGPLINFQEAILSSLIYLPICTQCCNLCFLSY